jgi:hypothetical protein
VVAGDGQVVVWAQGRDKDGKIIKIYVVSTDINRRKDSVDGPCTITTDMSTLCTSAFERSNAPFQNTLEAFGGRCPMLLAWEASFEGKRLVYGCDSFAQPRH